MTPFATLTSVAYRTAEGRTLFNDLNLSVGPGRTGLVGRNGAGKTTLLRLIQRRTVPQSGMVSVTARVAAFDQTPDAAPDASVAGLLGVAGALAVLRRLGRGEGVAEDVAEADWSLPGRLQTAFAAMGLTGLDLDRPWQSLSGGEATRARLAALTVGQPDLLLLDEPTNSLDVDGRTAVARFIDSWTGGVLLVSHDRSLLRRMDRIVELSNLGAKVYGGAWDLYATRKAGAAAAAARGLESARLTLKRVERESQAARERKLRADAAGRRSRARGDAPKILLDAQAERAERSGARQNHLADRQKTTAQANLLAAEQLVERSLELGFELPPSGLPEGKLVLAFDDVHFGWPGAAPLLSRLHIRITGPRRIALVGPNGCGKTTLIRLALGELAPTRGRVTVGVAASLLDQRAELLVGEETLLENYRRLNRRADTNAAHAALARFLFRSTAVHQKAGGLSGGERLRVALACVLTGPLPPQLIVLDEPTNHLDVESIEAVETALRAYDGALIVASHDEDFLNAVGVEDRVDLAQ